MLTQAYEAGGDGASIDWQDIDDAHEMAKAALAQFIKEQTS